MMTDKLLKWEGFFIPPRHPHLQHIFENRVHNHEGVWYGSQKEINFHFHELCYVNDCSDVHSCSGCLFELSKDELIPFEDREAEFWARLDRFIESGFYLARNL